MDRVFGADHVTDLPFSFTPPTPEQMREMMVQQEQQRRAMEYASRLQVEDFRRMCQFAAVMCTCEATFKVRDPHKHHSYQDCPIHGVVFVTRSEYLT